MSKDWEPLLLILGGWLAIFVFIVIPTHVVGSLVNEFLCFAILWIVPILCLLLLPASMYLDSRMLRGGLFPVTNLISVGLGIIWFYFFMLIFSLIGKWLSYLTSFGNFEQEGEIVQGVVETSENLFPSIQTLVLALLIYWVFIAIIAAFPSTTYDLRAPLEEQR